MNRSNSFVSSLKWWPLQGHNNNQNNNNNNNSTSNISSNGSTNSIFQPSKTSTFGSSVAVQKLRESKWFKKDEQRIFCAVVESGFIIELRSSAAVACIEKRQQQQQLNGSSYELEEDIIQDENATPLTSWFGIVLCKTTKDNKPKPETIEIYSIKIRENGTFKMIKMSLEDIWGAGWELRINNFADKEKQPHCEKDIRNQVSFARKARQSLWNNNKHFVYWCRYGSRQQDVRKRQMSECVKWSSVGMNAGMLLVMKKEKSFAASK